MNAPVRTTIVYAAISAIAIMPAAGLLAAATGWPTAFKLTLWADLLGYALLLAHWGGRRPAAVLFPLALLLGTALWPGVYAGFFLLGLGVLAWVRSGICFAATPVRAVLAETVAATGGAGLVALIGPTGTISWVLCIWLFFLIQSLYFFIVPIPAKRSVPMAGEDPFDRACRDARRVLEG